MVFLNSNPNSMKYSIKKANSSDIEDIYNLIMHYSRMGVILKRSLKDIEEFIDDFLIAESNNGIVGVVSFFNYGESLKKIRSLAVKGDLTRTGIGSALIMALVKLLLNDFPGAKIFVLTYSVNLFKKNGFIEISKDSLPEKIWKDCQNCKYEYNCGEIALLFPHS